MPTIFFNQVIILVEGLDFTSDRPGVNWKFSVANFRDCLHSISSVDGFWVWLVINPLLREVISPTWRLRYLCRPLKVILWNLVMMALMTAIAEWRTQQPQFRHLISSRLRQRLRRLLGQEHSYFAWLQLLPLIFNWISLRFRWTPLIEARCLIHLK